MAHFEINRVSDDGIELYIQGWESDIPAKAVVCIVHGLGEHSGRYAHVASLLNNAGHHVLAMDLRGHGKSTGQRGNVPHYDVVGKDITLLLAEAKSRYPTLPQILYGHSMGGNIVLYYVLRFKPQLAGVVVTSPGLKTALEEQKGKVLLAKLLGSIMPGLALSSGLDPNQLSRDPAVVEAYQKDLLVHDQTTLGMAKHSFDAIRYIYANGKSWDLPLLLMHGVEDKLAYAQGSIEFARLVSDGNCTLHLWESLTHELHNEPEKEEVIAYLIEQLNHFVEKIA
jgi:alpha-beta hydrolase superfamily lysophospholipase